MAGPSHGSDLRRRKDRRERRWGRKELWSRGQNDLLWVIYVPGIPYIYIFQSVFLPYYLFLLLLDPVTAGPGGEK